MTPDLIIAIGLGILVTHVTGFSKRIFPALTARETQILVFATCFVAAIVAAAFRHYATPEMIATLGAAFTTSVTWYEIVVKSHD